MVAVVMLVGLAGLVLLHEAVLRYLVWRRSPSCIRSARS
jgi:hypothetical protein